MAFAFFYFGFKVHPFRFAIFFVYMLLFPCFSVVLLVFVYRKATLVPSSNGPTMTNPSPSATGGGGGAAAGAGAGANSTQGQDVQIYFGTSNNTTEVVISQHQYSTDGSPV